MGPKQTPDFALSIKGGLAKGFGAIGIIRFLQEEGLQPVIVAGSSSGSMVAAMYALGLDWQTMLEEIKHVSFFKLLSLRAVFREGSMISYSHYKNQFINFANRLGVDPDISIEDLPTKLVIYAVDQHTRERVYLEKGPLIEGILASSAYPGIFPSPIYHSNHYLYDGDLIPDFGATKLREFGVDKVIGIGPKIDSRLNKARHNFLHNVIMAYRYTRHQLITFYKDGAPVDYELTFNSEGQSEMNFKLVPDVVKSAYLQARRQKRELLEALSA